MLYQIRQLQAHKLNWTRFILHGIGLCNLGSGKQCCLTDYSKLWSGYINFHDRSGHGSIACKSDVGALVPVLAPAHVSFGTGLKHEDKGFGAFLNASTKVSIAISARKYLALKSSFDFGVYLHRRRFFEMAVGSSASARLLCRLSVF